MSVVSMLCISAVRNEYPAARREEVPPHLHTFVVGWALIGSATGVHTRGI
jgi:hypothetical protein